LARLAEQDGGKPGTEAWETTNLLTVAAALVQAARQRAETRGAHWRDDHPDRDDARWRGHLDTVPDPNGALMTSFAPISVANPSGLSRDSDVYGCKP
jgi:succinate dehydrogenase/fumarate reductase flavoprotein subunit